jgi:hypothetical protein
MALCIFSLSQSCVNRRYKPWKRNPRFFHCITTRIQSNGIYIGQRSAITWHKGFYWAVTANELQQAFRLLAAAKRKTHTGSLIASQGASVVGCNLGRAGGVSQVTAAVHFVAVGHVGVLCVSSGGRKPGRVRHCDLCLDRYQNEAQ